METSESRMIATAMTVPNVIERPITTRDIKGAASVMDAKNPTVTVSVATDSIHARARCRRSSRSSDGAAAEGEATSVDATTRLRQSRLHVCETATHFFDRRSASGVLVFDV